MWVRKKLVIEKRGYTNTYLGDKKVGLKEKGIYQFKLCEGTYQYISG